MKRLTPKDAALLTTGLLSSVNVLEERFEDYNESCLVNGDFETYSSLKIEGWDVYNGAVFNRDVYYTGNGAEGSRAIGLTAGANKVIGISQSIYLKENATYKLSLSLSAEAGTNLGMKITYRDKNGNWSEEKRFVTALDTTDIDDIFNESYGRLWQESTEYYTLPAGITSAALYIYLPSADRERTVYIDGITLKRQQDEGMWYRVWEEGGRKYLTAQNCSNESWSVTVQAGSVVTLLYGTPLVVKGDGNITVTVEGGETVLMCLSDTEITGFYEEGIRVKYPLAGRQYQLLPDGELCIVGIYTTSGDAKELLSVCLPSSDGRVTIPARYDSSRYIIKAFSWNAMINPQSGS